LALNKKTTIFKAKSYKKQLPRNHFLIIFCLWTEFLFLFLKQILRQCAFEFDVIPHAPPID
jgi:hypothetical protein